jgi:amino acid transporter
VPSFAQGIYVMYTISISQGYLHSPADWRPGIGAQEDDERPLRAAARIVRRATMIVMGGIVGSGIFINPYVVALQVHTPFLILGGWLMGGLLALLGAFIWAELATRLPGAGGQYLYLREAYNPSVAFLWMGVVARDANRWHGRR